MAPLAATGFCKHADNNFLIVLDITGIFMNSPVSKFYFYFCLSMLALCICQRGLLKPLLTYLLSYF